jgi:hypothetical protein
VEIIEDFPFMLSLVKAFLGVFQQNPFYPYQMAQSWTLLDGGASIKLNISRLPNGICRLVDHSRALDMRCMSPDWVCQPGFLLCTNE